MLSSSNRPAGEEYIMMGPHCLFISNKLYNSVNGDKGMLLRLNLRINFFYQFFNNSQLLKIPLKIKYINEFVCFL